MDDDQRDHIPALPPRPETPIASSVRKAQVRAALFRKSEPIRIGRFVLLEPLGAGAMGEIFAAYDDQLDRKVALKLVRGGSELTAKADERLLREAQTLAQVSHPNVVQIYEAGTYNGRLFIAMELVRGKTLTGWLRDAARLPRAVRQREILRQFIAAGHGLEAAHAAGVAHRDFKPDNVLVGDDGRVRVVDFGLARALGEAAEPEPAAAEPGPGDGADDVRGPGAVAQDIGRGATVVLAGAGARDSAIPLVTGASTIDHVPAPASRRGAAGTTAARTAPAGGDDAASSAPRLKAALRLTETGMVMGTPFFMAPEQMSGAIADRRSDQFSFCVALYHALYDAFPFAGRTLRELGDSMQSDEVEFAPGVPVPAHVRRALHRGLSVDPARRFATMGELLAALSPRTRRLRGWIAAGAIALAAVAGLAVRSPGVDPCAAAGAAIDGDWSADRQAAMHAAFLRSELPFAESAWRGVTTRLDGYARTWRGAATAACRATYVAHTQSAQQLDRRMVCLERGRRQLAALIAALGTGAPDAVEHAVEAAGALPGVDACSRAESLLLGVAPPPAALEAEVARIRDRLAQAQTLELLGRYEESLAIARDAGEATQRLGYPPVHAEALVQAARALSARSTADARQEAQRVYFEALTLAEAERHDQLVVTIWTRLVKLAIRMDSSMAQAHEWWAQANAWSRRAGAAYGAGAGAGSDDQAELHYLLGEIYYRDSEYARSADEERRAIAALSPTPAHALELSRYDGALALSLERLGAVDEAMQLHERALAIAGEALGAGHPDVVTLEINYGRALWRAGHLDRARGVLEGALASIPARYRDSHASTAVLHTILSDLECAAGRLDRAAEHGRASLEIYQRTLGPDHVRLADAYVNLANVEFKRRSFDRALALYQDALALRRSHLGNDDYHVGADEGVIAETLVNLDRPDDALPHLAEAERIFARSSGRERDTQAWILTVRGQLLVRQRRFAAAVPVLEQALALFPGDTADPTNRGLALWALARAITAQGADPGRARALAERAHAIFTSLGAVGAPDRDAVARFLERLPRAAPGGATPTRSQIRGGSAARPTQTTP